MAMAKKKIRRKPLKIVKFAVTGSGGNLQQRIARAKSKLGRGMSIPGSIAGAGGPSAGMCLCSCSSDSDVSSDDSRNAYA